MRLEQELQLCETKDSKQDKHLRNNTKTKWRNLGYLPSKFHSLSELSFLKMGISVVVELKGHLILYTLELF